MVLVFAVHVELLDALYREFLLLESDLVRLWGESVGKVPHYSRESGGK